VNPIKKMVVTVFGNHGAIFIDMVGTVEVDRIAGQLEGGPGTNNVTMQNQLLGMQSGLLALQQDIIKVKTAINVIKLLEYGAMLWYIEWEHQANRITTCKTKDCRRGEKRGRRRSGGTWKSCCERPRNDGNINADADKSSQPLARVSSWRRQEKSR
jgi:hypothetical protein